ncbi:MAG: sulfite oxidase [Chloroflexi bacterium]|nr:sulfite oxidase [Chloroflexota bacterium]
MIGDELRILSREPFNAETPLEDLVGIVTPIERHFVRDHFPRPDHPGRLELDGAVRRPLTLTIDDLTSRPMETAIVTLECAGNGRAFLDPRPPGEPWALGAVGTAEWTGVRLGRLLDEAGVRPGVVEIRFRGADEGRPADLDRTIAFERSLSPSVARTAIVAVAMNGRPLPAEHGAPVRLIVPGWYGMASVKWLTRITAASEPFGGFYQVERYVAGDEPLGRIEPRAVVVAPADAAIVARGTVVIRGYAWSGGGGVRRVEVTTDGGATWRRAQLGRAISPDAWREWRLTWRPRSTGPAVIVALAVDAAGRRQPLEPVRDPLGYRNNAARASRVTVIDGRRSASVPRGRVRTS